MKRLGFVLLLTGCGFLFPDENYETAERVDPPRIEPVKDVGVIVYEEDDETVCRTSEEVVVEKTGITIKPQGPGFGYKTIEKDHLLNLGFVPDKLYLSHVALHGVDGYLVWIRGYVGGRLVIWNQPDDHFDDLSFDGSYDIAPHVNSDGTVEVSALLHAQSPEVTSDVSVTVTLIRLEECQPKTQ